MSESKLAWKTKIKKLHGVEPDTAWQEMQSLIPVHGVIRPDDVVELARDSASSMHGAFTWDDSKAAKKQRRHEARQLIRNLRIVYDSGREVPALVNVRIDTPTGKRQGYTNTPDALNTPTLQRQVLKQALSMMLSAEKRFKNLAELAGVWESVRGVAEDHGFHDLL